MLLGTASRSLFVAILFRFFGGRQLELDLKESEAADAELLILKKESEVNRLSQLVRTHTCQTALLPTHTNRVICTRDSKVPAIHLIVVCASNLCIFILFLNAVCAHLLYLHMHTRHAYTYKR